MISRLALLGFATVFSLACASKNDTPTVTADTGVAEDTAPVEDTAPWNTYPEGPYGLTKGAVFPPLVLKGYAGGFEAKSRGEWTDIKVADLYDPTGERKINAVLIIVSAEWCPPCREEAKDLPGFYTNLYQPRGARFLTTMTQNSKKAPADQATLDRWVTTFKPNFDIAIDPDSESIPEASPIPRNYIINPRNMVIYRVNEGVNPDATIIPGLSPLLTANGAPAPAATDAATTD